VETPEQLRRLITAQPFRPFRIALTGGREFLVRHPENVSCDVRGSGMTIEDQEGAHLVEMLLVEVMEPLTSPAGPDGNGV
jgi:hypothetical protein